MLRAIAIAALALCAGACGDDADCEKVMKHMAEISAKEPSAEEMKQGVAGCEKAGWSADVRTCLMKAKDQPGAMKCFGEDEAFNAYMARSKATEARVFIKKIYDGARAYYMEEHVAPDSMTVTSRQLPGPTVGPTPPPGSCCKGDDGKCAPAAAQWDEPVWVALQFSVDDPHYYSYQYEVSEDGTEMTARAIGDLDCDGTYSTFEMSGTIDPSMGEGLVGSGAVIRVNELE